MGPKKKQEQIDLSTLPQCKSNNIIIYCNGRQARSNIIIERITKQFQKKLFKIKRNDVIEHAKQKGLYVDPNTLTDKQKKDPKFMQTVCLQMTPKVLAKATQSLIGTLSVKIRMQKKANIQKNIEQKSSFDALFWFQQIPNTSEEGQQLGNIGQQLKYVIQLQPKLNWNNAPQIGQEDEQDDDIKQFKRLQKLQQLGQTDINYIKTINQKIKNIKYLRSKSNRTSLFRDTVIWPLQIQIDPYNQEQSLQKIPKQFVYLIQKLNHDKLQFVDWKKDKTLQKQPQAIKQQKNKFEGKSTISLLENIAKQFDKKQEKQQLNNDQLQINTFIDDLINKRNKKNKKNIVNQEKQQIKYIKNNQQYTEDQKNRNQLTSFMKIPGINRNLMPQVPTKSHNLRKMEQSQYSQYLKEGQSLDELFRKLRLLNFEDLTKQIDEERTYKFQDRILHEPLDEDSLKRQIKQLLSKTHYVNVNRYDELSDKLYVMFLCKSNARLASKKNWQANWKVLPNFENWIKYFKNNENNLKNNVFLDIDYEKIGNIQQNIGTLTLSKDSVLIQDVVKVGNKNQKLLYGNSGNMTFGINNKCFYSNKQNIKINTFIRDQQQATVINDNDLTLIINSDGCITFNKNEKQAIITPEGYSIVNNNGRKIILHPNGSVSQSQNNYVNNKGYGLKNGKLYTCPSLKRTTQQGNITKRDDGTVIISKNDGSQWIKFEQGTEYLKQKQQIKIQMINMPFIKSKNLQLQVISQNFSIVQHRKQDGKYISIIKFKDNSSISINKFQISINSSFQPQVKVNINQQTIFSKVQKNNVKLSKNKAQLQGNGKIKNCFEDQQKFSQQQTLLNSNIVPRIFIINNNNTGVQLLSKQYLNKYIKQNEKSIEKHQIKQEYPQKHILIIKKSEPVEKQIKNITQINLDIFDNTKQNIQKRKNNIITIRSILQYSLLDASEIQRLQKIKVQIQQWRKNNLKQQNQFGFKPKDQKNIQSNANWKKQMIKYRKQQQKYIKLQDLFKQGIKSHKLILKIKQQQKQKINSQIQLKKQMLRKRQSIVQDYKMINIPQKRPVSASINNGPCFQHYFVTKQGRAALASMPQWVFRPKQIKPPVQLAPQIKDELNNTMGKKISQNDSAQQKHERYDTVEVQLKPRKTKQIYIKPSVFTQRQIDQQRLAFESQKKAYKYHQNKRKDYNLYGQQRKQRPQVPTLLRTQPASEINQKYLVTQAPLDRKVKISSMKTKLTTFAANQTQMRKQGPHSLLIRTLDKGNDLGRLLERRTMMVQADLNDKLQRDILINPIQANFGVINEGKSYELKIDIKNQDVTSQRLTIKRPKTIHVRATLQEMGPIAMGMTRKLHVTIKASSEISGKFVDQFDIITKHEIYHIPITAVIVGEGMKNDLGKGVYEVNENRKKDSTIQLPRLK